MTERRVQTNFTADRGAITYVTKQEPLTAAPDVPAVPAPPSVPQGTAREVLQWVGSDKVRAQQALDAEKAASDPRKVLLGNLLKVARPNTTFVVQEQAHTQPITPSSTSL